MLSQHFFDTDACQLALKLLGKVICVRSGDDILKVQIIETEAYYKSEKASHASLGYTEKRKALFMPAGTIYMYHARGKPSLNFSAHGEGNAVLIKSGIPAGTESAIIKMLDNNRKTDGSVREVGKLCSGQTLVCLSLGINVDMLDKKSMSCDTLWVEDSGYKPEAVIQTMRLGIPSGRDGHLPFRFIDRAYADRCTKNPLKSKNAEYRIISPNEDVKKV